MATARKHQDPEGDARSKHRLLDLPKSTWPMAILKSQLRPFVKEQAKEQKPKPTHPPANLQRAKSLFKKKNYILQTGRENSEPLPAIWGDVEPSGSPQPHILFGMFSKHGKCQRGIFNLGTSYCPRNFSGQFPLVIWLPNPILHHHSPIEFNAINWGVPVFGQNNVMAGFVSYMSP